jgi:membrane-associated phospholipid phosphatase
MFIEEQLTLIANLQTAAHFGPLYFLLKLAILLAEENVFIVTTCALFWLVDRKIAVRALLLVLCSEYLNFMLKWSFQQPRPYWLSEAILPLSRQPDFGFPTAYVQDALVYWVYLASALGAKFGTRRFWFLPALIVPSVALATVLLGANFIHDTLAGLVIGAGILTLAYGLRRYAPVFAARPMLAGWLLILAAPVMNAALALQAATVGPMAIPGTWRQLALRGTELPPYLVFSPWNVNTMIGLCAALFGIGVYFLLASRFEREDLAPEAFVQDVKVRASRIFLGLGGLVLIKIAMAMALGPARDLEVAFVYGAGYFALTIWAVLGAPVVHRFVESRDWFRHMMEITTPREVH